MKHKILLLIFILISSTIVAQQITQQFTFSQNDMQTTQYGEFDIVNLLNTEFLHGEENAGKPSLPLKTFNLLLPQGASATNVSITINSEQQLIDSFYLYPVQLPLYLNSEEILEFVEPDSTIYNSDNPR